MIVDGQRSWNELIYHCKEVQVSLNDVRIDDGRSKYMEQSTMLEPSNNIGGSKFDNDEEMREIST